MRNESKIFMKVLFLLYLNLRNLYFIGVSNSRNNFDIYSIRQTRFYQTLFKKLRRSLHFHKSRVVAELQNPFGDAKNTIPTIQNNISIGAVASANKGIVL